MSAITASMVKELKAHRCANDEKNSNEANGDIEEAIVAMRKADPSAASKRDGKIAAEGTVAICDGNKLQ